jgi:regulator of sirC expression with transglutaminase-like and TPR domain
MTKSIKSRLPATLPDEKTRQALINLLGDEDRDIAQTIRQKILSHGQAARPWLEEEFLNDDPLIRRRVRGLLEHLRREENDFRFTTFCQHHGEEFDLEQGIWLVAQTRYPEINVEGYRAVLDDWASQLRESLRPYRKGESQLAVLNEFLFQDRGFKGDEQNYYDPENSYLNRVIDRRTGNPISLCLIYLLLGRRLAMPIAGIGFPGHFLCRYQSSREEHYIDAFNQGRLLTKAQCMQYLKRNGLGVREGYLVPISARRVLLRICANLHQIYLQLSEDGEAARVQRYLVALAK